jgi:hypothetical protein
MLIFSDHFQIWNNMFEPIAMRQKVLCYSAIVLFRNSIILQYCYSAIVIFRNSVIPQ